MHPDTRYRRKQRIKDLPMQSRPREKLVVKGSENISDAELLAILLRTGTSQKNVLQLAGYLLKQYSLKQLIDVSIQDLEKIPGIGKGKATQLHAAFELGRRLFSPASFVTTKIYTAHDVAALCKDITQKKQEQMAVLYLNARHELIQKEIIGMGNLNGLLIEPKEIFSHAFVTPCAEIIIVHNHPSGDPTPSDADIQFTTRVQKAGEIVGISLIDHIILTHSGFFSFREADYVQESTEDR